MQENIEKVMKKEKKISKQEIVKKKLAKVMEMQNRKMMQVMMKIQRAKM